MAQTKANPNRVGRVYASIHFNRYSIELLSTKEDIFHKGFFSKCASILEVKDQIDVIRLGKENKPEAIYTFIVTEVNKRKAGTPNSVPKEVIAEDDKVKVKLLDTIILKRNELDIEPQPQAAPDLDTLRESILKECSKLIRLESEEIEEE